MFHSLRPVDYSLPGSSIHRIFQARVLEWVAISFSSGYSPWKFPGQPTGVGSPSPLQGILPTQGLNPDLLHCRRIPHQLSHQGNFTAISDSDSSFSLSSTFNDSCDYVVPISIFKIMYLLISNFISICRWNSPYHLMKLNHRIWGWGEQSR